MPTEKIAPCPWCGKEPKVSVSDFDGKPSIYVGCRRGDHVVFAPSRATRAGAIKAWNERRPK